MKHLVILVADRNTEHTLRGLLQRTQDLGISEIQFDIRVHPQRDPGVYRRAHDFLRSHLRNYQYALVLLDKEGCGAGERETEQVRLRVQTLLERNGWKGRCQVVVIDPELDVWVWSKDQAVASALDLSLSDLEDLLKDGKPSSPKKTLERVLWERRIPRSSSLYEDIASKVDFTRCTDPAFRLLWETLRRWFGPKDTQFPQEVQCPEP
ncbi:MAG: hypothetical protein RMK65_11105 [Anaerolineae bacterium]|nr:hypothetical protein [Anaerolineae bacterium]MDW7992642.1 hypothetical protein [Anaerolineae bacterium]